MSKKSEQICLFEENLNIDHRKSRYTNLSKMIESKYNNTFEIDTSTVSFNQNEFNFIDLFAGGGGISLGFKQAGFNKILDVEILEHACKTLKRNFPESLHFCSDIRELNIKEYIKDKEIHLVVGGPPCQGFSVAGKRNPSDIRNMLFEEFHRIIKEVKPLFFVLENVPGIITLDSGKFNERILNGFEELGYEVSIRILEAADYGVPQLRSRAIYVGNRINSLNPYPKKIYKPNDYLTIDNAISDLEELETKEEINHVWTNHSKKFIERIAKVKPGESLYTSFRDAYKRQRKGHPSMTIKENHGGTHIHYSLDRCISAREMARIQTFPDDFIFEGSHKQAFIQIGNAVPVQLAKHIGLAIYKALDDHLRVIKSSK